MQELLKPVRLTVFRTILRHSSQDPLSMAAEHRKLHKVGRIEQHIGILLIRIDPLHLGTTHIRPVGNSLLGRERALVEIPHNTPQQTVVTCRNTVMVIQRNARDGIYEDAELL